MINIINTIPHVKCFVWYLPTRCFCIRNFTRSLRPLVRFLIRQQLVCKYRTPALSMKYSLFITFIDITRQKHILTAWTCSLMIFLDTRGHGADFC